MFAFVILWQQKNHYHEIIVYRGLFDYSTIDYFPKRTKSNSVYLSSKKIKQKKTPADDALKTQCSHNSLNYKLQQAVQKIKKIVVVTTTITSSSYDNNFTI